MMRKKCEGLLARLNAQLEEVESQDLSSIEKLKSYLSLVNACLAEMKVMVNEFGFDSELEEIEFFKVWKPRAYGLLVFATERYSYEGARPLFFNSLADYYNEQLRFIARFFRQHEFMYQYYRLGMVEMDRVYFLRGISEVDLVSVDMPGLDASFATPGDYLFSKFIGLEKMQALVIAEINVPEQVSGTEIKSKKGRKLRWTGDSCNLIEVVYGIFDTKQLNDGEIDMSDIIDVFELVFQVNLSRYFRRFTEIKRRKTVSKTKFLDSMVDAVNKRIDDGDAYVPASLR